MVTISQTDEPKGVVAFAGGGTGGHLYPALAIAGEILAQRPRTGLVFFGTQRPIDAHIVEGAKCELVRQRLPGLTIKPWRWPAVMAGFRHSSELCKTRLQKQRPLVVIGTGGYGSVPAVRQARRAGIPTVILNPDALPGRANRYLAGKADLVFVQWQETIEQLPTHVPVIVSGCAIRPEFHQVDRVQAAKRFGFDTGRKTLLITGASQGAQTINSAVLANLDLLEAQDDWQVLHLTGEGDFERVDEAYRSRKIRATVLRFTDHMADAIELSDLVVSRSGASTLAELTAMGKASILLPYPFHRDMHQLANARCLVRAGAAILVRDRIDADKNGPGLRTVLEPLLGDGRKRAEMAAASHRLGKGRAATEIAEQILKLIGERGGSPTSETLERERLHAR